jgi:prepilin-type N-terminal cleavage/methylation domain-containing protein
MTINKFSKNKGFTLVETLVAISILLIAVVGPMSLIGDAFHKLYYAKDEIIAINLAQEGIEAVRQARDSNMLSGSSWMAGLTPGYYIVDVSGSPVPLLDSRPCTGLCTTEGLPVYLDVATGLYRQSATFTATQFSRIVRIEDAGFGSDERKITSTVSWRTGGNNGTIVVIEYIFKWALP